jgi:hypothetical protein
VKNHSCLRANILPYITKYINKIEKFELFASILNSKNNKNILLA